MTIHNPYVVELSACVYSLDLHAVPAGRRKPSTNVVARTTPAEAAAAVAADTAMNARIAANREHARHKNVQTTQRELKAKRDRARLESKWEKEAQARRARRDLSEKSKKSIATASCLRRAYHAPDYSVVSFDEWWPSQCHQAQLAPGVQMRVSTPGASLPPPRQ